MSESRASTVITNTTREARVAPCSGRTITTTSTITYRMSFCSTGADTPLYSMSSNSLELRALYAQPRHSDGKHLPAYDSCFKVRFRHPGYSDSNNILIILPGLDHAEGGVHIYTAQIACAILANNRWDGYFTERRDGPQVDLGSDGVLRGKDYYFQVPDADEGTIKERFQSVSGLIIYQYFP